MPVAVSQAQTADNRQLAKQNAITPCFFMIIFFPHVVRERYYIKRVICQLRADGLKIIYAC
ncbi:MAG: hypothetical protein CTY16_00095 [Methylobacter sp.]|nr:MAG: hypothetical protein CTY16_00095 [Methylobacter sp.]